MTRRAALIVIAWYFLILQPSGPPKEIGPFASFEACRVVWWDTFDGLRAIGATWALPSKACFRKP